MLHRLHAVRHPASLKMKSRRQQVFVTVAASDSHGRSRGHDARPNHVAIVNRVAQRNVRVVFRAEVAHGGNPPSGVRRPVLPASNASPALEIFKPSYQKTGERRGGEEGKSSWAADHLK